MGLRILGGQNSGADGQSSVMTTKAGATYNAVIKIHGLPSNWRMAARTIGATVEGNMVVGQPCGRISVVAAVAARGANARMVKDSRLPI